jgi:hypothetical protein
MLLCNSLRYIHSTEDMYSYGLFKGEILESFRGQILENYVNIFIYILDFLKIERIF